MRAMFIATGVFLGLSLALFLFKPKEATAPGSQSAKESCSAQELSELASGAKIEPVVHDAILAGWSVHSPVAGSLWEKRGFKDKDLIIELAGTRPQTPAEFMQAMSALCSPQFTSHIERQGKPLILKPK